MSHPGHHDKVCKHGVRVSTCRCMGPKIVQVVPCPAGRDHSDMPVVYEDNGTKIENAVILAGLREQLQVANDEVDHCMEVLAAPYCNATEWAMKLATSRGYAKGLAAAIEVVETS